MQKSLSKHFSAFLIVSTLLFSCNKKDTHVELNPSEILSSKSWSTTDAKNEKGERIPLHDQRVINFLGYAYYEQNGSFAIFSPDDTPKMRGTWSITPDGKTRTLVTSTFTRIVEITILTEQEFTYRIFPNTNDRTKFIDIIHTPTTHVQPPYLTPSQILGSTRWVTSDAKNEKGEKIPLTDQSVSSMVGYSTFNSDGNFSIFNLDHSLRLSGTWSISADGKTRTLVTPNFTRTVDITVLTKSEFTYRIFPIAGNSLVFLDIIHTPAK